MFSHPNITIEKNNGMNNLITTTSPTCSIPHEEKTVPSITQQKPFPSLHDFTSTNANEERCYSCQEYDWDYYTCVGSGLIYCCDCIDFCLVCDMPKSSLYMQKCVVCEQCLYLLCIESSNDQVRKSLEEVSDGRICKQCYRSHEISTIYCHTSDCATQENAEKYHNSISKRIKRFHI